jgi:hypothetical protein
MGLDDYGKYTKLVRKLERREGGTRVKLAQLMGLLSHVEHDSEALLSVFALAPRVVLRISRPDELAELRVQLFALGVHAHDPEVGSQALRLIWRQQWCVQESLGGAKLHFWLCDLAWQPGERASAHRLVQERLDELAQDAGMLPLLVDMYSTSQHTLAGLVASSEIPSAHAVGVFLRHIREREGSLDLLRWAWRGVVSEERERVLLMLFEQNMVYELGEALICALWADSARPQEHVLLLRMRDRAPRLECWRVQAREALGSAYGPLHMEAVHTLRQYGKPDDVEVLLEAAQGRSEAQQKGIQEAIKVIQRGADQQRFAGALSLQEDDGGGQGALSLAGGEVGGLSQVGAQGATELVHAEPQRALVVADAPNWMEASPAPRPVSKGARVVLLARGANPRLSLLLLIVGISPPLLFVLGALLGVDTRASWGLHTGFQIYILPFFFLVRTSLWSAFKRGAVVEGELRPGVFEARSGKEYKLKGSLARRVAHDRMALVSQDRAYDLGLFNGLSVAPDGGIVASKRAVALAIVSLMLTNNVLVGMVLGVLMCVPAMFLGL